MSESPGCGISLSFGSPRSPLVSEHPQVEDLVLKELQDRLDQLQAEIQTQLRRLEMAIAENYTQASKRHKQQPRRQLATLAYLCVGFVAMNVFVRFIDLKIVAISSGHASNGHYTIRA